MKAVDYTTLLDADDHARSGGPARLAIDIDRVYRDRDSVRYRSRNTSNGYRREVMRVAGEGLLLSTDCSAGEERVSRQIVSESDWVHLQFRMDGDGHESLSTSLFVATPPQSCIVTRYPRDTLIDRKMSGSGRWRYVCLFLRPQDVVSLIDASPKQFPEAAAWLAAAGQRVPRSQVLPLTPAMAAAARDVISCEYFGVSRRGFMRGKSLELLSSVVEGLAALSQSEGPVQLSRLDREKVAQARRLLETEELQAWTLGALARQVGLNRSKLAAGFKALYGMSVRRYWRDANLDRTRELLAAGEISVTEAALSMGYSDPYSFTRAFSRRFGSLPREAKKA